MKQIDRNEFFMSAAIGEAEKAAAIGEVPVGAVIVWHNKVIAKAFNTRETEKNALCHAEIKAINEACEKLGGWRLFECDLFVTLEPCPMCTGAIINSRIKTLVFGASDPKAGAVVSKAKLFEAGFNHSPEVIGGVLGDKCSELLSSFFLRLRQKKKPLVK